MEKAFKTLLLESLDQHISKVNIGDRPAKGWIKAVRSALGMTTTQLAKRMSISQQALSRIEKDEIRDTVTLKTLRNAAQALECRLIIAFVPTEGSLKQMVLKQAQQKAADLVLPVDHTMRLEAQGVGDVEARIEALAKELAASPNSTLWD